MIIVDTSAVVDTLVGDPVHVELVGRLAAERALHAPHLIDIETVQALRKQIRVGRLSADRAAGALSDFSSLRIVRYSHLPFVERIWALRDNLSAYDAAFVALSEALDVPLVTCDARLAAAPGHRARVETYARGA